MAGYPDSWKVPSRNRQYSNQPGGLASPEQPMIREFTPESGQGDYMRMVADAIRSEPSVEADMDYEISNQPEVEPYDAPE